MQYLIHQSSVLLVAKILKASRMEMAVLVSQLSHYDWQALDSQHPILPPRRKNFNMAHRTMASSL